jgi:hypothetical protein
MQYDNGKKVGDGVSYAFPVISNILFMDLKGTEDTCDCAGEGLQHSNLPSDRKESKK